MGTFNKFPFFIKNKFVYLLKNNGIIPLSIVTTLDF